MDNNQLKIIAAQAITFAERIDEFITDIHDIAKSGSAALMIDVKEARLAGNLEAHAKDARVVLEELRTNLMAIYATCLSKIE